MKKSMRACTVLLVIFALSGFSGLIYESVWAQYLKLFLGHAAYAQTMVLCIFMGGLALGAALAARYTRRISHPLLAYAAIEAAIGLLGLVFHAGFTRIVEFHYESLLPLTTSPWAAAGVKGFIALLLIGPQTVLLGATFPLMTCGVLRAMPESSGQKISMLYFANSIGAAVGVLASAFVLIPWSGLPGTILSAGLMNIAVGLAVWLMVRRGAIPEGKGVFVEAPDSASPATFHRRPTTWMLLGVAAFTGMASFIYEVVWIRMLSLVLGASTHSFELMLSAFITGLALGSLAIRRRIDRFSDPYRVLGYIQIVMGVFALGSLWVYSASFSWMAAILQSLALTDPGYTLFLLASHGICFLVMLPATFMAGMTLPLITYGLLRGGYGERALGAVYSVNTLGSIAGVLIALHLAIPLSGLKASLIMGAGLDVALGIALLALTAAGIAALRPAVAAVAAVAGVVTTALAVTLEPHKLYSGVYRYRHTALDSDTRFLYAADGKTASISLHMRPDGMRVLSTNGKPDASLTPLSARATPDEITMILAAALGMAFHPEARSAANIGLGSGLTTQTLLRNRSLEVVDTIEIEQKMVDAARLLKDRVGDVFTDRRSRIIVDDAKSFFAAQRARYDIIIAEPSNPWVSGVASLFTAEFYHRILDYLSDRGVFVQWLQLYEIDHEAIASVMLALGRAFSNYTIYTTNDGDLLVVAWKSADAREPDPRVLRWPDLRADLERISVNGIQDVEARRIGAKAAMEPLFRSYPVPQNSDYFPYLEDRAARARFRGLNASGYKALSVANLPLMEMLERRKVAYSDTLVSENPRTDRAAGMRNAVAAFRYLSGEKAPAGLVADTRGDLSILANYCEGGHLFSARDALVAVIGVSASISAFLTHEEARRALAPLLKGKCLAQMGGVASTVAQLLDAIIERDGAQMRAVADQLLGQLPDDADMRIFAFAVDAAMLGAIASQDPAHAQKIWQRHGKKVQAGRSIPIENRLLMSVADVRMRAR